MKICAIICEFNPFHNGHKYLLDKAKELSGCDGILCIMSGNFTQRGEACILDKYTRAKHAVLGGADCVIQLPAPFAVAPAEIFAKGAIKILSSIPDVCAVAFGCEQANKRDLVSYASLLIDESGEFKKVLNANLNAGESYVKSYAAAFKACGGDENFISRPNNILALEYTKAILISRAKIDIIPVNRIGSGYKDDCLKENYSSASSIRKNLGDEKIKNNVPDFVSADLPNADGGNAFGTFLKHCLFKAEACSLKRIYGCGEGLENKLKSLENQTFENIVAGATSKRYSSSRIRRILLSNALGLYSDDTLKFLNDELYIKPLAVKKQSADIVLAALSKSVFPVVTGINTNALNATALQCFEKDKYEFAVYNYLNGTQLKDYMITV